ncbi:hypothetical protein CEXT_293941 [Caerostris extrusa]|uniref:Uncharacterized protein n=1 Tax=Caerostris extrusa TaxID=172846 RepID=A0AAV4M659_CAEEX|nr:hypothetical protein CEXT_293941 [Caerostris extrusa]
MFHNAVTGNSPTLSLVLCLRLTSEWTYIICNCNLESHLLPEFRSVLSVEETSVSIFLKSEPGKSSNSNWTSIPFRPVASHLSTALDT